MNTQQQPSAVFIMGPTASGKTALAIDLVKHFPFEIISVDSALVYKGMDIGTAKPNKEELAIAPHHLIDLFDPVQSYSTAAFREDALRIMDDIHQRNKIPLLVGGTMLYHRSLLYGLSDLPSSDPIVRQKLALETEQQGTVFMHEKLMSIDPDAAQKIHPNDPQRVQRALEVYEISGKTMTQLQQENKAEALPWKTHKIIIAPDSRDFLRQRIATRFEQMIEQGFIEEVEGFFKREDLNLSLASMRAVGYRQVWEYLEGKMNKKQMVERGITITRQFAKRQMTWLRREEEAYWIDTESDNPLQQALVFLKPILK
ncbi:MAG: tRNA (adenosine(37)-N6)-dimethylallyltransferase MiaA [Gammaproteobacteria bacterium]|nr:tRNA (adenosine(37)-N6)-dimethylallyltransferase MiaA [Gammaproteobacteria bacterium]